MLSLVQALLSVILAIVALVLWKLYPFLIRAFNSSLKNLPGPPSESWLYGNLNAIHEEDNSVPQERWARECNSHTIMYRGFFNVCISHNPYLRTTHAEGVLILCRRTVCGRWTRAR